MKRPTDLLPAIAGPDNLRLAFCKAKKGKARSQQVLAFQQNLDANLLGLRSQLLTGLVEVGDYRYFRVHDPKERQICAAAFGEQVLHHALMNRCHPCFEQAQIHDSYASRPGKGIHAALARAQHFARRNEWHLQLDVRKFFGTVHHDVLKEQLRRLFPEVLLRNIFEKIIDSYEDAPGRGLPIGNLTSQYFANHYLCGLDHFIKEKLRCKAYVRYMDDLVLWHPDKAWLQDAHLATQDFVETKLRCELKPAALNRTSGGITFLGYRVFPHHRWLARRSKRRFIKKLALLEEKYHTGQWDEATCQRHALPLIAFTRHADALDFRKNTIFGHGKHLPL